MPSQIKIKELSEDDKTKQPPSEKSPPRKSARATAASKKQETDLRARLAECFERVADSLETRGDDELAEIVREDADVMASGLVGLTRPFKPIRALVLAFVAVLEPLLAFGRILRVAAVRWADKRAQRREPDAPPDAS